MAGSLSRRGKYAPLSRVRTLRSLERGALALKEGAAVRAVLVYPNRYEVGMASLGFQTVYRLWNAHDAMRCERAFVDDSLYGEETRSFETGDRLGRFDVVGYSVSFELDIPNVLRSLISSHLPLYAADRTERDPLIFVGGAVASLNPSPLLPFIDGLQVGEGEDLLLRIGDVLSEGRRERWSRSRTLTTLSEIEGLYIVNISDKSSRHTIASLNDHPVYTPVVTPRSHFSSMFVVEMGRGCGRGCFFCGAQKVYRPCRYRTRDRLLDIIEQFNPGAVKVGLEGAGLSDYPDLEGFCRTLLERDLRVSFSSIRPDRVTSELIDVINRSGIRTFTMAPEGGDETLRRRIGKGIPDDALLEPARLLAGSSVQTLKLYFIIGLPGETDENVLAIPKLVRKLATVFLSGKGKRSVRLSVNAFVPKPFTEFQWAAMNTQRVLSQKRKAIKDGLRGVKGVVITPKSTKEELFQGALSVGGEDVGSAVVEMIENNISWKETCRERNLDLESLTHRGRSVNDDLPWDWMAYPVGKDILWHRYRNSLTSKM